MSETIEKRLASLGVVIPAAAAPAANYVPFVRSGNLLFPSGQLPMKDGKLAVTGLLGRDLDTAAGKEAAKLCAINVLAQAKAEDVSARLEAADDEVDDEGSALVLGCDSMLELDGEILGKPADAADAVRRWRAMRGRAAVLHTGHWLVDARDPEDGGTGGTLGATSSTTVHFADVDDDEIDAYVATGAPLHVAGAFTIDGLGGPYVERIEGDHHGVVGLSLPLLRELLGELEIPWRALRNAG